MLPNTRSKTRSISRLSVICKHADEGGRKDVQEVNLICNVTLGILIIMYLELNINSLPTRTMLPVILVINMYVK